MDTTEKVPHFAVVWVDHNEARVLFLHREDSAFDEQLVRAHHGHDDARHANGRRHHVPADDAFFADVTHAIEKATDVWMVGPANARVELMGYLEKHHRDVQKKVKGVEKVDHPTNGELAELGRQFFERLEAPKQIFVRG